MDAPGPEANAGAAEATGKTQQAVSSFCSTVITSQPQSHVKQLIGFAKQGIDFLASKAKDATGYKIESAALSALNDLIGSGSDLSVDVQKLSDEIDCVAQSLDWKVTALAWVTEEETPVHNAWKGIPSWAVLDPAVAASVEANADTDSANGTASSADVVMFQHLFVPSSTNSNVLCGNGSCNWKDIVRANSPDTYYDQEKVATYQSFDWRLGLPRFASLVPLRLAVIAALDPDFVEHASAWSPELEGTPAEPGYRVWLQQRLQAMLDGIRCDTRDVYDPYGDGYEHTDVACADVNTGLSAGNWRVASIADLDQCKITVGGLQFDDSQCLANLNYANAGPLMDSFRREIRSQMPIFEIQSMIDTLGHLTHPAPDLAEAFGRIPVASNPSLCLDVQWGNPASGTPVWIWGCNGTGAQQWTYDRNTQTIRNTALNKCLQVRPSNDVSDNIYPGALAEIWDCYNPPPLRQQWSYDPETGVIHSALGTVLDIQWNNQQPGTPVWLWDYNGGTAQQWRADHSGSYCNGICDTECESSCAGAGAYTGQCMGGCMSGCMGSCMGAWP